MGASSRGGRRPPAVEESLVDIREEDPGAQGFRTGLAHRAGAYPEAAILSSGLGQATSQSINPPAQPTSPDCLGGNAWGLGPARPLARVTPDLITHTRTHEAD